jgi:hypothetical protein
MLTGVVERNRKRVFLVLHHMILHALVPPVRMLVIGITFLVFDFVPRLSRGASSLHVNSNTINELFTEDSLAKGKCLLGDEASKIRQMFRPDFGIWWTKFPKARVDENLYNPNLRSFLYKNG